MAETWTGSDADEALLIENSFADSGFRAESYRYNSASVRIRVIDERFRGKSKMEREDLILPILERLPDEIRDDIMYLLLLTQDEVGMSLMNLEYEDAAPSRL